VAVIQGLRAQGAGAGVVLAGYERGLLGRTPDDEVGVHAARVLPEWVDYNGHMHESRYLQLFGDATDALLRHLAVDVSRGSYFTVETHLSHMREATADERVQVSTLLLDHDQKRLHVFHELRRDASLLATAEQMLLHVDASTRRAAPAPPDLLERVAALADAHARLPRPDRAGRAIGMGR
jgi:carnitine 3-dehydrogenase